MSERISEEDLVVQPSDMALINVESLYSSGSLDLSPRYQRRNRWDRARQSQLIESFLLNVPVPPVYLAEESKGVYAVIDGKQRLTAIVQYLSNEFPLTKLDLRKDLEGLTFENLPREHKTTLGMRPLRAVTILRQTPDWVKHEVFVRLNRGGQPLNAQEIRNVAYAGPFNDTIIKLATHEFLRQQLKISDNESSAYSDMSDVESVVRFFALSETWRNYGGSLRDALDDFMLKNYQIGPRKILEFTERFNRAIGWCSRLWGDFAFKRHDGSQWRDQMIGGVYDAQMIAVDQTSDSKLNVLKPNSVAMETRKLFKDSEFDSSVRVSTNTSSRVRYRIQRMIDVLDA
ncbi:DUF262 domain-containing protein [Brevibacterium casei]|uniref:DUF262 domain-containing protein n=1 Tax=Brevibacterium casei TaxID=33889 RepID=UPI00223B6D02|nr:DUF262 domain-containing protein [Brevibacterium casei]MCT2359416.1 DUF262 domain-containing protein [Brevibacterium casei]